MSSEPTDPMSPKVPQERKERTDVQGLHAQIARENDEPRDGFEPVPVWMTMAFGGLLFWGGMYMSAASGNYRHDILDRPNPVPVDKSKVAAVVELKTLADYQKVGKQVYNNCAGCHQQDGNGQAGGCPPLNASEWVSGEEASPARLSRILLYGLQGPINVKGKVYNQQMPAWGRQLKDHQIAGVLTYIRSEWDNKGKFSNPDEAIITTEMVAAARAKDAARDTGGGKPMSEAELKGLPVAQKDDAPAAAAPAAKDAKGAPAKDGKDAKDAGKK